MMKIQFSKILYALVVAATLLGCNATTPPEDIAVNLFNALTSGDLRYVKQNIHFTNPAYYDAVCDYLDLAARSADYKERTAGYTADYKAVKVTYEGDVAWVELQGVSPLGRTLTTVARMLQKDGRWVVDGDYTVLHSYKPNE